MRAGVSFTPGGTVGTSLTAGSFTHLLAGVARVRLAMDNRGTAVTGPVAVGWDRRVRQLVVAEALLAAVGVLYTAVCVARAELGALLVRGLSSVGNLQPLVLLVVHDVRHWNRIADAPLALAVYVGADVVVVNRNQQVHPCVCYEASILVDGDIEESTLAVVILQVDPDEVCICELALETTCLL